MFSYCSHPGLAKDPRHYSLGGSADQINRMRHRAHSLEKRLWADKGKPRPRGRNRERLVEARSEADTAFESMFAATVMRRWGHLFKAARLGRNPTFPKQQESA